MSPFSLVPKIRSPAMAITPLMPVYPRSPVRPVRGEGCYLYGEKGEKYLDFASGIAVNLLEPAAFKISEDETGLFDKLKTASELASRLSDNSVTLSFLRKGKEVVRLGKGAHPTLSKFVTRSDDVQMSSVREFRKLKKDLKAG